MADDEGAPSAGLDGLFAQLQAAQADLEARAAALDSAVVEGSAAGGAVVVRVSGALAAESVHIDPAIIDPADPALLEDALLAALRDKNAHAIGIQPEEVVEVSAHLPRRETTRRELNARQFRHGLREKPQLCFARRQHFRL